MSLTFALDIRSSWGRDRKKRSIIASIIRVMLDYTATLKTGGCWCFDRIIKKPLKRIFVYLVLLTARTPVFSLLRSLFNPERFPECLTTRLRWASNSDSLRFSIMDRWSRICLSAHSSIIKNQYKNISTGHTLMQNLMYFSTICDETLLCVCVFYLCPGELAQCV